MEFDSLVDDSQKTPAAEPRAPAAQQSFDSLVDDEEKYGSLGQQAITGLEGGASALTFGLSTGVERALGVPSQDIRLRRETNPIAHGVGELAGIGAGMLLGSGEAAVLERAGAAAASAFAGETALAKVGSMAARLATENALFTAGDEVSRMFAGNGPESVGTAIADIGLSGLIGAGTGAAFGSVSPLWKATVGSKVESMLHAVKNKAGGIEGLTSKPVAEALDQSGMQFSPEVRAALSEDPQLQIASKTLEQSNTGIGLKHRENIAAAKKEMTEYAANALGADAQKISEAYDVSPHAAGVDVGNKIADELEARINPLAKEFEELKAKAGNVEIPQPKEIEVKKVTRDSMGMPIETTEMARAPGLMDEVGEKISNLAAQEKWIVGDGTPGADLFEFTMKHLRGVKDIDGLNGLVKRISDKANSLVSSDFGKSSLNAASRIKSILREAEAGVIEAKLGEQGAELVDRFRAVRKAWGEAAGLVDELSSHINLRNAPSSYGKALRSWVTQEGEAMIRRIGGTTNAAGLKFLQENFPSAAAAFKDYHINQLLRAASKGMPKGEIALNKLMGKIGDMPPEMRGFLISPEAMQKLEAAQVLKAQLEKAPHNFSNTARTLDKLTEWIPGGAASLAMLLSGHGTAALVAAPIFKAMTKDAPDALRLAMLKFVGSNGAVDSAAFKAMVDMATAIRRGESAATKAAKSVLKEAGKVDTKQVSENDRKKLDKRIVALSQDPAQMLSVGGDTGHYMPEHAAAMGETAARAVSYLASLRPVESKQLPLDSKLPVDPVKQAAYDRALDIAENPLIVLNDVKNGSVKPQDLMTLQKVAPGLYSRMRDKLTAEIAEHDGPIPYKTRLGLSIFLGQPLDSTMTPMGIQSSQPMPQPMQAPQQQVKATASGMQKISKLGPQNATGPQMREMGRAKHA